MQKRALHNRQDTATSVVSHGLTRASRVALTVLELEGIWHNRFLLLRDEHVRPLKRVAGESEGRWTPSWIWLKTLHTQAGASGTDVPDGDINDGKWFLN